MSEYDTQPIFKSELIEKKHFPVFDTFRFFAFLKVFLQHLPIFAFAWFNVLRAGGIIGVQFFFVLSGFLITYIIFNEKKQTGTYSLKNFFARRILRIWPLFYLLVGVSYVIPYILAALHQHKVINGYEPAWWVSCLFLENYKMIFTHSFPREEELSVTWSLCVEEHFYIIWGLLLWIFPIKAFPKIAAACIVCALVARSIFAHYNLDPTDVFTTIDLFALGAIPAYLLVFHAEEVAHFINKVPRMLYLIFLALVVVYVIAIAQIKNVTTIHIWLTTLSGIIFSALIFLSTQNRKFFNPSAVLTKAGTYTYGLYMYHILIIVLLVRLFDKLHLPLDQPLYATVYVIVALVGTYICSVLSYRFFEMPFLKMKQFFRSRKPSATSSDA